MSFPRTFLKAWVEDTTAADFEVSVWYQMSSEMFQISEIWRHFVIYERLIKSSQSEMLKKKEKTKRKTFRSHTEL